MIKKYGVGGPWEDVLGEDSYNSSNYIKLSDPNAKLSQPGNINLRNMWDNFNIKLKQDKPGFSERHPYLADTVRGAVSGATMLLNNQSQRQMKKAQRDYVNDPFNLYSMSSMKKYGSRPWLDSTGQFTDFPNEKVPVFEPGYQNSAYTNPMATAKKGGQLYMTFQDGGATNQMGAGSSLPRYEMGAGSPIQQALLRDNEHYGLPMAKSGGFFTPEKLTAGTENFELYEKPNNFLNYLRDMSANTVVQNALGRRRKGQLSDEEAMGMAQMGGGPQQGGQEEQLMQMVAQALQQGASPEEIMQKLVEMGIPEEQAMQVVQMVAEQMQGGQEQMPEEMPQEMGQPMPQGMEQQMAAGMEQQMPIAQMGMGGGGGDFEEFGFDSQNPLNPYYQNLYDPSEAKQVNASLVEGLYNSGKDLFSQPTAYFKGKQADAQAQLDAIQKFIPQPKAELGGGMTRYQSKGITKPTATDAAGFEKWYNETMGNLISTGAKPAEIEAFMTMAGNWASDAKLDRNQLQQKANNPNRYTTEVYDSSGNKLYDHNKARMTRGVNQDKYQQEYLDVLKKFDTDYEVAAANNKIASSKNPNADPNVLRNIEAERDKALADLETKYAAKPTNDAPDYFYSKPGTPAASTTTPGTTTNTTNTGGGGAGGYQFNPAMQQLLSAMAQGYTKAPLFGFRTNRNINALFNQTMADMMLKGQGQGQGTAGANTPTVPGVPAVGPGANAQFNTWLKDNNINRYDITQNPNKFKMRIRANQPGQGVVQYDDKGNLITNQPGAQKPGKFNPFGDPNFSPNPNKNIPQDIPYTRLTSQFDPSTGYRAKSFLEEQRNKYATNRLQRLGTKLDASNQKEQYLQDLNSYDPFLGDVSLDNRENRQRSRRENRYEKIAERFGRGQYEAPEIPEQRYGGSYAYGGAYSAGGQYKEGGTYYLSDEEIQALINAGYELE
jgi:hypothetical protein